MNIIQETDCNQIEKKAFHIFFVPSCQFNFFLQVSTLFFFIWGATQTFTFFLDDEKKATLISQVVQKESEEWSSAVQFDTPLVILNLFHCGVRNIYPSTQILKIELATQKQKQNNFHQDSFLLTQRIWPFQNLHFIKKIFKRTLVNVSCWMMLKMRKCNSVPLFFWVANITV